MEWIMSAARCTSTAVRAASSRTASTFGGECASHSRLAAVLLSIAVSGWLTSCAIDAASSPRIEMRAACAISA